MILVPAANSYKATNQEVRDVMSVLDLDPKMMQTI